jgi:ATP-dependent RNA helicase HelY
MSSPAERYAAARRRADEERTALHAFRGMYDFPLDPFQVDACEALEAGRSVLVAAPTGSGKTVAAEFAVLRAVQRAADGKAPAR